MAKKDKHEHEDETEETGSSPISRETAAAAAKGAAAGAAAGAAIGAAAGLVREKSSASHDDSDE